jgi:hypothetical protein
LNSTKARSALSDQAIERAVNAASPASADPATTAARVGRASGRIENATASAIAHQRPIATALREVRA